MLSSSLRPLFVVGFCACLQACAGTHKPTATVTAPAPAAQAAPEPQPLMAAAPAPVPAAPEPQAEPTPAPQEDPNRFVDVVTEAGQRARGAYFNGPMARKLGPQRLIDLVRGAGLNAVVIDIKDGEGRVTYDTQIPELQGHKRVYLSQPKEFVSALKQAGLYTIARVVCFNDPVLPKAEPDRSIHDGRPGREGQVWQKDAKRNTWLDPYNTKNHDTLLALSRDVEAMGFDEIQFDYVRFPVDVATKFAVFPAATDTPRSEVLLGFLRRVDEALRIPIAVDVFGLTALRKTSASTDQLGQDLEAWAAHVEIYCPMLYVNGMQDWMRHLTQGRAGMLVQAAVEALRKRLGSAPVIRPYLQAFENGADYYNGEFIAEQIRGSRQGGGDGILFWHPASNYGMVRAGMLGPARTLFPFPIDERRSVRDAQWGNASGESGSVPAEAAAGTDVGAVKPAS